MKFLALDIETSGLDAWRDKIHMCGLFDGQTYTCVREPWQLRNLLNTVYKDHLIVGHRTDFDIKFLLVQEWLFEPDVNRPIHDSRIMGSLVRQRVPEAYLEQYEIQRKELNKTLPKGQTHREGSPLSLKVMAPWYLKVRPFWEVPGNHNDEEYNRKDCVYTLSLAEDLSQKLQDEGAWSFYLKLLNWSRMTREMEMRGIDISLDELDLVEKEYLEKRDTLKTKLDEMWAEAHQNYTKIQEDLIRNKYWEMQLAQQRKIKMDDPKLVEKSEKVLIRYDIMANRAVEKLEKKINYSSPSQMSWLLKDYLGLNIQNAEGEESTGKAVLHRLAQEGREDIKTYLEWREADKVLTMYIPTYRELHVNGTIHPSFNLTGTRTGRTSSSSPNLQQVPAKLYRLFRPRPDHKFIQYDLSGIEAALIALYSGDERLTEIIEKGESIHDHNAKAMFGLECGVNEVSKLHPKERKTVKNIGFACFYGAGWRRISQVFAAGGFPITDQQAKQKLLLLKSYYPQVFEFHKEITEIFEAGETVYNLLGRPITLQPHDNPYMQGFNTLIQSSASDLNLEACYRYSKEPGSHRPLLVIHDCIIAEAAGLEAEASAEKLVKHMTNFNLGDRIKLKVEGGVSEHWEK